jgi:type VI secretion system secreted protein Hcp
MADVFLKIDGIPGDSKDTAHPDEIEVLSWSWRIGKYRPSNSGQLYDNGKTGVGDLNSCIESIGQRQN